MLVAGIMSGTSADAIDVAVVEITGQGWKMRVRLRGFHSVPYAPEVRRKILAVAGGSKVSAGEISQLNFLLGELFAEACKTACRSAGIPLGSLGLVGSHGQTIYHQNRSESLCGFPIRSTFQIAEGTVITERTDIPTVTDFRPADIAAGGQGAPLVPFFDYLMFRHPRRGRVVLNIGGIANLTAIPAGGKPEDVIAFDTGPGNMLLDALATQATRGKIFYDRNGKFARQGRVNEVLLRRILRQKYFHAPPPKTAGREQFGAAYLEKYFLPAFARSEQGMRDALATATALTAESIRRAVRDFVLPKFAVQECVVSGGGSKNHFLMEQLSRMLSEESSRGIKVLVSDALGIPSDAKEAMAFAVLAYQTYHRQPSNLCAATGAHHPAILGKAVFAARK